jgi:hypothetical protein
VPSRATRDAEVCRVERNGRHQRSEQDLDDVGPCEEGRPDVREQSQRQPLEDFVDEAIASEDLERDDPQADRHDEGDRRDGRHEQIDRRRDRTYVRPRVQGVGDDEGDHSGIESAVVVLAQYAGQTLTGHQANLGAHVLDGRLHGQHGDGRPECGKAILRTGLGVGPDARRIVVRCPGDQARTKGFAEAPQCILLGPKLGCFGIYGPVGVHPRLGSPGRWVPFGQARPPPLPTLG